MSSANGNANAPSKCPHCGRAEDWAADQRYKHPHYPDTERGKDQGTAR